MTGAGIPCLGYPSRTSAVLALRAQGLTTREIAQKIGVEIKTVSALEGSAARKDRGPSTNPRSVTGITIDPDVARPFRKHAERRGITVRALVHRVLDVLIDDNLIDAILDDEAANAR